MFRQTPAHVVQNFITSKLAAVLGSEEAALAAMAVTGPLSENPTPHPTPAKPTRPARPVRAVPIAPTSQADATVLTPRVRVQVPGNTTSAPPPARLTCDAAVIRAGVKLTPSAAQLHDLLVRLGTNVAHVRGYRVMPSVVTFHLPACLMARARKISRQRLYQILPQLEAAGLVAQGGHASLVDGRRMWDGSLWTVKTRPDGPDARTRADEWRHEWRDFAADLKGDRTAKALGLQLQAQQADSEMIYQAVLRWAVSPGHVSEPVGVDVNPSAREVVYALPSLAEVPSGQRGELISAYASSLARHFRDEPSRRWWAGLLHEAVTAQYEGRGGLEVLAAQLGRLMADVREWVNLRRPGALLAARLRAASHNEKSGLLGR